MHDKSTTPACTCGAPSQVYADDDRTPLCAKCWLAIYDREEGDDAR